MLLLGVLALGVILLLGLARLGSAAVARARADTAAELGALAAADQVALGAPADAACSAARVTVLHNGATLVTCTATPTGARVQVVRRSHGVIAHGHARAEIDASP